MAVDYESSELNPGLYKATALPAFNARQAWSDTLPESFDTHDIRINGGEILRITTAKPKEAITRQAAEMGVIREVVQTGSVTVTDFQKVRSLKSQLVDEYARLLSADAAQHLALDYLDVLDTSIENTQKSRKIIRAAGYIAARHNLWVVTKRTELETGSRISVAKLVGLAALDDEETTTQVYPVVKGKNKAVGVLRNVQRRQPKGLRPDILDVIESTH